MLKPKKGWKKFNDTELLKFYDEIFERAVNLGYISPEEKPPLYMNNSSKQLGLCNTTRYRQGDKKRYESQIVITKKLFDEPEQCKKTLVHELAHAVAPEDHHGHIWKTKGDKIGQPYNIFLTRTEAYEDLPESLQREKVAKYAVECPVCKQKFYRMRQVEIIKHPENYWHCDANHRLVRCD